MTDIELNAILYYADYLKLEAECQTVTDTCKYFFIHGTPMNAAFIAGVKPDYDENDFYFKQALKQYTVLKEHFQDAGVLSFINNIANLSACGCVDATRMLACIHQFSDKKDKKQAFKQYYNWLETKKYTHETKDELGKSKQTECSKYVYHFEKMLDELGIQKSFVPSYCSLEEDIEE